jgi:DNA repair exonuclease SbcCD ATPase subunit
LADNWRLERIEATNFRGCRNKVVLPLEPGMNVVAGPNGGGKSTLCHAFEWAMFGKLPALMSGEEWRTADALANRLVTEQEISVGLCLRCASGSAEITRTRRRGTSSTTGSTKVRVDVGGESLEGAAADAWIADCLGLDGANLGAGTYLRQDTIAELVSGDDELRSTAIDRILGMGEVRDLLDSLQLTAVHLALGQLTKDEIAQQQLISQAEAMRHVQLQGRREELKALGFSAEALTPDGATQVIQELRAQIARPEDKDAAVDIAADSDNRARTLQLEVDDLLARHKERLEAASTQQLECKGRITRFEGVAKQLEDALALLGDVRGIDLDALKHSVAEASKVHAALERELKAKAALSSSLEPQLSSLTSLATDVRRTVEKIAVAESKDLTSQLETLVRDVESKRASLHREGSFSRLLADAQEYLSESSSDRCPVCEQGFDNDKTLARIRKLQAEARSDIDLVTKELGEREAEVRGISAELEALKEDKDALTVLRSQQASGLRRVLEISPDHVGRAEEDPARAVRETQDEVNKLTVSLREAANRLDSETSNVKRVESAYVNLDNCMGAVRELIGKDLEAQNASPAIKDAHARVSNQYDQLEAEVEGLRSAGEKLALAQRVVSFVGELASASRIEEEVKPVRDRLAQLAEAQTRVRILEEALLDISNALTSAQQEILSRSLSESVPEVQEMYTALGGHPDYEQLKISPVTAGSRGANFYRIAVLAATGQEAIARTVLSRAELNDAALALFLSLAKVKKRPLSVAILDDPSQSLDAGRTDLLSKVLVRVSREMQLVIATEDPALVHALSMDKCNVVYLEHLPASGVRMASQSTI